MNVTYPFTEDEMDRAAKEWGANCGPAALAFALQIGIEKVRGVIPGFEEKGYTSPTMMKAALANLGRTYFPAVADRENMFRPTLALVRIQFTGPWTAPGANGKWAYTHTHWIATWSTELPPGSETDRALGVFDCNGGALNFDRWRREIVPILTAAIKRADGGWYPTHIWRVKR